MSSPELYIINDMKLKTERTAVGTFVTNYGGIASDVCMHIIDARARFHEEEHRCSMIKTPTF